MFAPSVQDSLAVEATLFEDHTEVYDLKFKVRNNLNKIKFIKSLRYNIK